MSLKMAKLTIPIDQVEPDHSKKVHELMQGLHVEHVEYNAKHDAVIFTVRDSLAHAKDLGYKVAKVTETKK